MLMQRAAVDTAQAIITGFLYLSNYHLFDKANDGDLCIAPKVNAAMFAITILGDMKMNCLEIEEPKDFALWG